MAKNKMIELVVGSLSAHKLEAVREVCRMFDIKAKVSGIKTESGQNPQPIGMIEIYNGALTRAMEAKKQKPGAIAIGIENGIFWVDTGYGKVSPCLDIAVIVVFMPHQKGHVSGVTSSLVIREQYVDIATGRGLDKTTVGEVIAESLGGDATDPHAILTNGKITRRQILVEGLRNLFVQVGIAQ